MNAKYLFIIVIGLLNSCSPVDQKASSADKPLNYEPDSLIVSKLQEIVELRERGCRVAQLERKMGTGGDNGAAEIALANARIELVRERKQADLVMVELKNLVKQLEENLAREKALAEEDRRVESSISGLRVAILKAEVRLRREAIAQQRIEQNAAEQPATALQSKSK